MPAPSRLLFVNLPVRDLDASIAFFTALGFDFDPRFTDDTATCMVISDQAYAMLLVRERFADFATQPVGDPAQTTTAIMAVSAASRAEVDRLADAAQAAGASPANDPMDYGEMYSRSFHDLDGHLWEVMWISAEAVEQGAAGLAESGA